MKFDQLAIPDLWRVCLEPIEDERGFFARTFCSQEFREAGLHTDFMQHSVSNNARRGTLRGLHYQRAPHAETKLVRCSRGAAFDVIVDLRESSPTFGHWHAEELSAQNGVMLYIPEGCAHGFQTLEDATDISYLIMPAYVPEAAYGIAWDDPDLAIKWPVTVPILSNADQKRPRLKDVEPFA